MELFHLVRGQAPKRLANLDRMPDEGFVWMDCVRETAQDWEDWPRRLLGVELDRRHVADSQEPAHKSFFDVTPAYDLLIFEEVGPREEPFPLEARSICLFLFERMLISVRAADNLSFAILLRRFEDGVIRSPGNVRVLAQMVLDIAVDRSISVQEALGQRMDDFQERLLDPRNPFNDWQQLLAGRREARRLEHLCQSQVKTLDAWHRGSMFEWTNPEETRLRDVSEHVLRVLHATTDVERQIEAAVQLYFASTSHRTSEIVRTLTVFSAIFLPLTFLVGIYGMNFVEMPELTSRYGYPALLLFMVVVAGGLLLYFRRRGFL